MRWFRFYDAVLDDPKVQQLSPELFRIWVNLLCLSSKNSGRLPPVSDIAFALRLRLATAKSALAKLKLAGLIDADENGLFPHNWEGRQYTSDSSTERVRRHREKKGNGSGNGYTDRFGNVSETPPDTDTDTETERERVAVGGEGGVGGGRNAPDGAPTNPEARARPLPINFGLSPALCEFGFREGFSHDEIRREFDRFHDHWLANGERKVDWQAAFRNWVRKARDLRKAGDAKPVRNGRGDRGLVAAYQRAIDSFQN
jgi:hypothetical protein